MDRTCTTDGCEKQSTARRLCRTHYSQWRRSTLRDQTATEAWLEEREALEADRLFWLQADEKPCSKCGRVQPKDEFTSTPRSTDGLHSWCKACLRDLASANYDSAAARVKHQQRKTDPAYVAQRKSIYDEWRRKYPERAKAASNAWRAVNPDSVSLSRRQAGQRRRAVAKGVQVDPLGIDDFRAILVKHGMVCHICRGAISSLADLHFDHVIPLALGGPHTVDNIRPSHGVCNLRKGNRIK